MNELRFTCENCGLGVTSAHTGAWTHTCPDGSDGRIVEDGQLDFTTTRITAALKAHTEASISSAEALKRLATAFLPEIKPLSSKPRRTRDQRRW